MSNRGTPGSEAGGGPLEAPPVTPSVSIVIPCYNPSVLLFEALASVRAQTQQALEVILVDDGTDRPESRRIVEAAAAQVHQVIRQDNLGPAAARNAGFHAARGRFVAPLDADDLMEPGFVEQCLAALAARPEAAYVYTRYRVFGDKNYVESPGRFDLDRLLDRNYIPYCALMRREVWEAAGGYNPSLRFSYEDWDLWLRFAERGHAGFYLPQVLFKYRRQGPSYFDAAQARHEENVKYIYALHPELIGPGARARIKFQWAPAACLVGREPPGEQTIEDVQTAGAATSLTTQSPSPAFLFVPPGGVQANSAELAALAIWGGHPAARLPDGSVAVCRRLVEGISSFPQAERAAAAAGRRIDPNPPVFGNLHRHLVNAGLLSWRSWVRHPWRSLLRLIPLRLKEAANRAAGKPVFDLSFYMQFQPRSLMLGPVLVEPLRYCPRPAAGRARAAVIVPHLGMGGAESVLLEMIASLPRDRFEILVLATQSRDDRWRARWAACAEHIYDLAALVPPDRMTGALYSIVMNWKCDLVVVQNSLAGYSAIPQIKRDLPSAAAMDIIHALDEQWDQVACTAGVGPYLDWRVAFSGSVRRRLLAAGTPAGRLRSLRSGVDLERFVPAPAAPGGALHRILFAGRLDPVKRPILLVEVAARLRALRPEGGFQFVIAGDGPEMPRFRRAVHRAGLDPFFDFRGEVAEMAPLYPAADILILVSRAEGVPLVLAEAMACARPVVASNVGDVAELLDSSCGILIDVSRREALHFAVALDTLLRQPRLRASLGKEARRRIVAHCDIRKMRDEYAALFVDALESSRQPDPAPSVDDA